MNKSENYMQRIFIVGAARSGTTLMQSILGSHSDISTFPETHFFSRTIPYQKILRFTHSIKATQQSEIKSFFIENDLQEYYKAYTGNKRNLGAWVEYLLIMIDTISSCHQKKIWIEKTPLHIRYIDLIEKRCPNCIFIHMVREPIANIAALFEAGKKYPDHFSQSNLKSAISRYKTDTSISNKYRNKPNHYIQYYEQLILEPEAQIHKICGFLGIDYQKAMLNFSQTAKNISQKSEKWKDQNIEKIAYKNKVNKRLSEKELVLVKKALKQFNYPILNFYEKN